MKRRTKVFHEGNGLVDLTETGGVMPDADYDAICAHLTRATNGAVQFDWSAELGHVVLIYLGDHAQAKAAYLAEHAFLQERHNRYNKAFLDKARADGSEELYPPFTPSLLGTLDGPEIAGPNATTFYQTWNREK